MGMKGVFFLLTILYSLSVFGNAEPIDIQSSLKSTGNLVALQKTDIEIKKEKLNIVVDGVWANVEVNYTYFNKGKEEVVDFAFPVDFVIGLFDDRCDPTHKDIEIFKIKVNGKEKIYDHTIEKKYCCYDGDCRSYFPALSNDKSQCDEEMIRRWYVTEVQFPSKKETAVSINYIIHASGRPQVYSGNPIPEMDTRKIFYDFSPAQYFGAGKADEIEIIVDTGGIGSVGGKVIKITPEILKEKEKGIFSFSGKEFDFKKNPNLLIEYDVKDLEMWNYFKENRDKLFRIKASSISGKEYGAENLFDGKAETAWCFEGGKEQWVELELFSDAYVKTISIINGNLKNKHNYEEHGKVTEFKMVSDCLERSEKTLEFGSSYKPAIPEWNTAFSKNPFLADRMIWEMKEGSHLFEKSCKIKILIKSTTKGTKYNNVCISEVFLM